jgi:hypothetical protein
VITVERLNNGYWMFSAKLDDEWAHVGIVTDEITAHREARSWLITLREQRAKWDDFLVNP